MDPFTEALAAGTTFGAIWARLPVGAKPPIDAQYGGCVFR